MLIWSEMLQSGLNLFNSIYLQPSSLFWTAFRILFCKSLWKDRTGPVWFPWGPRGAESQTEELGRKPRSYCWECTNIRGGVAKSRTCRRHRARAGQMGTGWAGAKKGEVRGSSRRLSNRNIWRLHILSFKKEMITLGFSLLSSLIKFIGPSGNSSEVKMRRVRAHLPHTALPTYSSATPTGGNFPVGAGSYLSVLRI